ncbi:hypothetical protein [Janthinobacterium sp. 1_2014MBL_MicDiv]|uniref:hypothetical protein n=1 Tax=Janthinobacterium sp. 1_2014MBL_MicDiv TaxID=1644131 RepID=UPI0008F525AF|nr:hypothetical protein [Janthinobacterium sp. 1_2014MBL_MicDiv]APA68212.1 hypothetical protein YQ44_10680 [Janthinobacterium sp. 1_2014MBL_MicDiv]
MTSVSSLSPAAGWTPSATRAADSASYKTPAASAPASTPSTIVALSGQDAAVDPTRSTMKGSPIVWESGARDGVSDQIATNFSARSFGGRFSGLGAVLLDQLKDGVRNVSQAVQQPSLRVQRDTYAELAGVAPAGLHGNGEDQVTLSVTTKSGVEVKLSLDSQGDGLAVRMMTSGELSDAEASALGDLSEAFQDAIDGMAQQPPKARLAGLMQFDQDVLASVNLHAEVRVRGEQERSETLDFQADGAQRKVSFSGVSGSLDVKVDTSQLSALGSPERQAKALGSYMKQFDQAASRGHGDAALMGMFKEAFTAMSSNAAAPPAPGAPPADKWRLAAEDRAMLTGLPDFSASISQTAKFSNPMRSSERDGFQYEVSQSTTQTGASQDDRSVRQKQQSRLSASFHETLVPGVPLRLTEKVESQNYTYHQIEDTASSDAQMAYREGKLVKASLQQAASQSTHITKFMMGKVESDVTTPTNHALMRDLLSVLGPYKTGELGMTPEKKAEQRQQLLLGLSDDVLLQSYPGQMISLWQADVQPKVADAVAAG